jgi:hypothetical protein
MDGFTQDEDGHPSLFQDCADRLGTFMREQQTAISSSDTDIFVS